MSASPNEDRREEDRRIERVEARQTQIGEDVAVLKAGQSQIEEEMRQFRPLVLEQSEVRSEIRSLVRGDKRLEERLATMEKKFDDGNQAREEARQEAKDRATELAEARRRERWKQWGAVAVAFILATATVVAAVISTAPPHP